MIRGQLYLIEYDLLTLYDWDISKVEQYLALFASFEEWCKQSDEWPALDE